MKTFENPEMNVTLFSIEDILTASNGGNSGGFGGGMGGPNEGE